MLKKKGSKDSNGDSTSGKKGQAEVIEGPCDDLTAESGKGKYSDAWLLDSRCTYQVQYL